MRAILIFLSSLLAFVSFNSRAEVLDADSIQDQCQRYSFQLETSKAAISGIFIAKEDAETITGTMVNEFGISAISFVYSIKKDKVKLLSVISFLDKWYIKMVLKKDIKFCIHTLYNIPSKQDKTYGVVVDSDTVAITNNKRHIRYTFIPLITTENNDTEQPSI
jgi:hypothetical protein